MVQCERKRAKSLKHASSKQRHMMLWSGEANACVRLSRVCSVRSHFASQRIHIHIFSDVSFRFGLMCAIKKRRRGPAVWLGMVKNGMQAEKINRFYTCVGGDAKTRNAHLAIHISWSSVMYRGDYRLVVFCCCCRCSNSGVECCVAFAETSYSQMPTSTYENIRLYSIFLLFFFSRYENIDFLSHPLHSPTIMLSYLENDWDKMHHRNSTRKRTACRRANIFHSNSAWATAECYLHFEH